MTTDAGVIRPSTRCHAVPAEEVARSAGHQVAQAGTGADTSGVPDDAFRDGSPEGPSGVGPVGSAARRGTCVDTAATTRRAEAGQSRLAAHGDAEVPLAATDAASIHTPHEILQEGSP